ncbi:MAG: phosphoribosylformylglycinamidine cyclo-ligase [Gemmatimonadota bacterium]|nr:phosphoribosylformylglycinamidine cyclo-ligase [Gemmatimonadota bacterium]
MTSGALRYRNAGVDISVSDEAKSRISKLVLSTHTKGVLGGFGGFGGMFRAPTGMRSPVLVSSADGVGTKIRVAIEAGRHSTIGHDLVNHCVNDILTQGAVPLFFLDYVAFGALDAAVLEDVVMGVAAGCRENECALVGGETAEMPGIYTPPDYDLAGFIVGCVEEDEVKGSPRVEEGDVLVGLASSGLHTNGYSLARKIVAERMKLAPADMLPGSDQSVADALLTVHRSYLSILKPLLEKIHAMAHITGGGLPGNLDRVLPANLDAIVDLRSWDVPPLFSALEKAGEVPRDEMFRVFNMGVGMVVIAAPEYADQIVRGVDAAGIAAWPMGEIRAGSGNVVLD